jgi:hypothetical protein
MAEPLEYKSTETHYAKLTLEQTESEVRLIIPPPAQWLQVTNLAFNAIFWLMNLAYLASPFVVAHILRLPLGPILKSIGLVWMIAMPLIASIVTGVLVMQFIDFRRRGHVPNVLSVSNEQLIWTRRWLWGIKTRIFPAHEIASVAMEKFSDILQRNKVFKLRIRFRSASPWTTILRTSDPKLPEQIVEAFRRALKL